MSNELLLGLILLIVAVDLLNDLIIKRLFEKRVKDKVDSIRTNIANSETRIKEFIDLSQVAITRAIEDHEKESNTDHSAIKTRLADEEREDQKRKRIQRKAKHYDKK